MDKNPYPEVDRIAPDRFYFNEMKREIADIVGFNQFSEYEKAKSIVDVDALTLAIAQADLVNPSKYAGIINAHEELTGQLWNYMTTCFDETAQRRESDTKDFRSAIVCLASACIRVARFVDMVKVNTLGLDAGTGFTNAYTSSISFCCCWSGCK